MDGLYSESNALDYWRLCDELSVAQAALLIAGNDPSQYRDIDDWRADMPTGYDAARAALINAIRGKRLSANVVDPEDKNLAMYTEWDRTTIMVEDLQVWLKSRGIRTGFFFPSSEPAPDYLSPAHDHYSPRPVCCTTTCSRPSTRSSASFSGAITPLLQSLLQCGSRPRNRGRESCSRSASIRSSSWPTSLSSRR
jgi:hypothetical protein